MNTKKIGSRDGMSSVCDFCLENAQCGIIKTALAICDSHGCGPESVQVSFLKFRLLRQGFSYPHSNKFCQFRNKRSELTRLRKEAVKLAIDSQTENTA
ncbi:MAG: hypothetical protein HRU19_22290 [Pseudobacteriovorax sp.]|nr:hypothetical protein [Pseudobacteriovorax sp.]